MFANDGRRVQYDPEPRRPAVMQGAPPHSTAGVIRGLRLQCGAGFRAGSVGNVLRASASLGQEHGLRVRVVGSAQRKKTRAKAERPSFVAVDALGACANRPGMAESWPAWPERSQHGPQHHWWSAACSLHALAARPTSVEQLRNVGRPISCADLGREGQAITTTNAGSAPARPYACAIVGALLSACDILPPPCGVRDWALTKTRAAPWTSRASGAPGAVIDSIRLALSEWRSERLEAGGRKPRVPV